MDFNTDRLLTRRNLISATLGATGMAALTAAPATAAAPRVNGLEGKKVLVAIGDFSEGLETYYMIYRLIEEGVKPVVAAAKAKQLQMVVHDFDPQYSNYTEKLGYYIQTDIAYDDVQAADFDGLLVPGGRGAEEARQYESALNVTRYFLDHKLPVGAMCHGPQLLYTAGSMKGRRMTAFPGIRFDLEAAGATFIDEPVVVDGPLVTSRGWPDLPYFMPKFLEVLAQA
ncbi:MAG: peptidase [Planctomycetaceae bacterium]|nr:peptidase [Planctomycetaceae bacterium]